MGCPGSGKTVAIKCCLLFLLFFLVGCGSGLKETYLRGDRALSQGRFQEAYRVFQEVVDRGGGSKWAALALLKLAQMERTVYHRPAKALDYCERLVKGPFPREFSREARLMMAQIEADDLNRPLEGLKILESMEGEGDDFQRDRLMVEYAIRSGDLKKAARLARVFLEKREGLESLRFALILADLFHGAGDFRDAEELYKRVISRARGDLAWEATLGLAGLREDEGRLREALALLKGLKKEGYKPALVDVKMRHIRRRLREERG